MLFPLKLSKLNGNKEFQKALKATENCVGFSSSSLFFEEQQHQLLCVFRVFTFAVITNIGVYSQRELSDDFRNKKENEKKTKYRKMGNFLPQDPLNVAVDFDFVANKRSSYRCLMYVVDYHLVADYVRHVVDRLKKFFFISNEKKNINFINYTSC